jgi:hypothetical protein
MSKLLSRLSLKKQVFCIEIKNFELVTERRNNLFQVSLSLQRGKSTKQVFSEENQIGNCKIPFNETLNHVSMFYINQKTSVAQKKMFDITVKGFDSTGKSFLLGEVSLDISQFVN